MKSKIQIILGLVIMAIIFSSCGQTDEDIEMEKDILGEWTAYDDEGNVEISIPVYIFRTNNEGETYLNSSRDDMRWEIVRGQLKVYYDEAPDYYIGYDKYNSRSLFHIKSLDGNVLKVTQFYNDGFQANLEFERD